MNRYAGSCLCGEVTFEVTGELTAFFLCHCSRCRKATGSAHAANLFSQTAALKWLSGSEMVKTFRLPGTRFAKTFCGRCSGALPTAGDGRLLVPAGGLDCDVDRRPDAHIFMTSKANWEADLGEVARHDELPFLK